MSSQASNGSQDVDIDAGFAKINALLRDVSGILSDNSIVTKDVAKVPPVEPVTKPVVMKQPAQTKMKTPTPTKKEDQMESLLANLSSADDEASLNNQIVQVDSADGKVMLPPKGLVDTVVPQEEDNKTVVSETQPVKTKTQLGAAMAKVAIMLDSGANVLEQKINVIQGVVCAPVTTRPWQGRPGCTTEGGKEDGGGTLKEPSTYYLAAAEGGYKDKNIFERAWAYFVSGFEVMPRWMLVGILLCVGMVSFVAIYASVDGTPLNQALLDYYDANAVSSDEAFEVAFIGNSYLYVNDVPRMMESISSHKITQQSVINTNAGLGMILKCGNGMYELWNTENAYNTYGNWDYATITNGEDYQLYDFGFCTVPQLLEGYDGYLSYRNMNGVYYNCGTNPCFMDEYYMAIVQKQSAKNPIYFDYVVLTDQTKRMANEDAREDSLNALVQAYAPLVRSTKAIPILVDTHAYLMETSNSTLWAKFYKYQKEQQALYKYDEDVGEDEEDGVDDDDGYGDYQQQGGNQDGGDGDNAEWWRRVNPDDIAQFTSDIYQGLYEYADALKSVLPSHQAPKIAKIGLTYLAIYNDNMEEWFKLLAADAVHASPYGSYLFGCVLYAAIYGHMPKPVETDDDVRKMFVNSRSMFGENLRYPTVEEANYLRKWARKVQLHGYIPKNFQQPQDREDSSFWKQLHANDTYIWPDKEDDAVDEAENQQ